MGNRSRKARGAQSQARAIVAAAALALTLSISLMTFSAIAVAEMLMPGDLDPSFAYSGSIVSPTPDLPFLATTHSTVLVRPDGKLLVGARGGFPFQLDSSGMPDSSYRWLDVS